VTSMEKRFLYLTISARNPQRRQALPFGGQPPRADEGDADGSGAVFSAGRERSVLVKLRQGACEEFRRQTTVIIASDL